MYMQISTYNPSNPDTIKNNNFRGYIYMYMYCIYTCAFINTNRADKSVLHMKDVSNSGNIVLMCFLTVIQENFTLIQGVQLTSI